jgi:four helix bundle protein
MGWSYRDLEAWQKSMELVVEVYRLSKQFPKGEQFGLTPQMRRSAVSIPANIAEGQGRLSRGDFARFLQIARGSLTETETHLLIAIKLEYVTREEAKPIWHRLQEASRLLTKLMHSIAKEKSTCGGKIAEGGEVYHFEDELEQLPDL